MVFIYFFTLHALTKFFSQHPQTTFSIIKVASLCLWPNGDRPPGQHHRSACAPLLVILALSTCWGSQGPPITALETCPHWLHRSDQTYGWLLCLGHQGAAPPVLASSWPIMALTTSTSFFLFIYVCVCVCVCVCFRVKQIVHWKVHMERHTDKPRESCPTSLQSFNIHLLVPWSFSQLFKFLNSTDLCPIAKKGKLTLCRKIPAWVNN